MKVYDKDISVKDAIDFAQLDDLLFIRRSNGLLLSDYQVSVLNSCGINYQNYTSMKDLLFEIEEALNNDYDERLDIVSEQLAEYVYYNDTNK